MSASQPNASTLARRSGATALRALNELIRQLQSCSDELTTAFSEHKSLPDIVATRGAMQVLRLLDTKGVIGLLGEHDTLLHHALDTHIHLGAEAMAAGIMCDFNRIPVAQRMAQMSVVPKGDDDDDEEEEAKVPPPVQVPPTPASPSMLPDGEDFLNTMVSPRTFKRYRSEASELGPHEPVCANQQCKLCCPDQ